MELEIELAHSEKGFPLRFVSFGGLCQEVREKRCCACDSTAISAGCEFNHAFNCITNSNCCAYVEN